MIGVHFVECRGHSREITETVSERAAWLPKCKTLQIEKNGHRKRPDCLPAVVRSMIIIYCLWQIFQFILIVVKFFYFCNFFFCTGGRRRRVFTCKWRVTP